jgi:translocator protein
MKKKNSKTINQGIPAKAGILVFSILLCEFAGLIGTLFTFSAIKDWYQFLNKPIFSPPNWLFGPVWTILYAMMGVSLYHVWKNKEAKTLFYIHLFFNAIWSIVFFGLKDVSLAFANILVIWIFIIIMIVKFQKINKTASLLLMPYLAWVTFASCLNYAILILN